MNKRIEIVECPVCGATCKMGSDDDWQVFCACCKVSFKPKEILKINIEEYNERMKNAKKIFEYHGWEAFK